MQTEQSMEQTAQNLKRKELETTSPTGSGSEGSPQKKQKRSDKIADALKKVDELFAGANEQQRKALNELTNLLVRTQRKRKPTSNHRSPEQNMRTQLKRMVNRISELLLKNPSWDEIKLLLQDNVFMNLPNEHICIDEGGECEALIHMLSILVDMRTTNKWENSDKRFWYAVALALEQAAELIEKAQNNEHWKRTHAALIHHVAIMKKGLLPFFFNQSCAERGKTGAIDVHKLTQKMQHVFGACDGSGLDFQKMYKDYRDELKAERVAKIQAAKMKKKKEEEEARKAAQENAAKLAAQSDIIAQLRAQLAAKTSGSNTEENKGADSDEGSSDSDSEVDSSDDEKDDSDHENDSMLVNVPQSPQKTPNSLRPLLGSETPASMEDIFDSDNDPFKSDEE